MKRIRIEGIKLSEELSQVNLLSHPRPQESLARLCRILAGNRVSMPFISAMCLGGCPQVSCCVPMEDRAHVKRLLDADPDLKAYAEVIPSVGLMSIFPHQANLRILGLCLHALGRAGLPVRGMTSSLAPLTLVTDFGFLDAAVSALEEYLELPPNQRPIRAHIRVKQSHILKENDS